MKDSADEPTKRTIIMVKIDDTVKKETTYIAAWTGVLSCALQAVFLIAGKWSLSVLAANLLTDFAAVLNFFLMGLTVQKAVDMEQKDAANLIRFSQSARLFMQLIVCALGVIFLNAAAAIVPLFFPRIGVSARILFNKNDNDSNISQGGDVD